MLLALSFAACAALYFLPSWLGAEKQNRTAIFLLNLLLGWTVIGWVVALVWAVTKEAHVPHVVVQPPQPSSAVAPAKLPLDPEARLNRLRQLRDSGAITQQEFLDAIL